MPRWLLVGYLVLGTTPALCAQETPWGNKFFSREKPPPAVIVYDFGTVPVGNLLSHKFPLTNLYAVPMQITDIRSSCGCVEASASKQTLQPRESGTLDVRMDARKFTGNKTVTIYVTFGPQYISTAVLQVRANARADVTIEPGLVKFGSVPIGKRKTEKVKLQYAGELDWKLTGRADSHDEFEVRYQEWYRQPGRIGYNVYVTLKENAASGPLAKEIILKTNDPTSPLVRMQVMAHVQASIEVKTPYLKLGPVPVGQKESKFVMLQGSRPFRILKVEGADDNLEVTLPPTATPIPIVKIIFKPTKAGSFKNELKFVTDLDPNSKPTVVVEGTAIQP